MHDDHNDYVCSSSSTDIIAGISNDEEIYAKEVVEDEGGSHHVREELDKEVFGGNGYTDFSCLCVLVENRGADLC